MVSFVSPCGGTYNCWSRKSLYLGHAFAHLATVTHPRSLSQQCQKFSLALIVVAMTLRTCWGVFWFSGVMIQSQWGSIGPVNLYPWTSFWAVSSLFGMGLLLSFNVEGFHKVKGTSVEGSPLIWLNRYGKGESRGLQVRGITACRCHLLLFVVDKGVSVVLTWSDEVCRWTW